MTVRTIGQILRTAGPSRAVLAAVLATAIPVAAAAQQTESPAPTPAPSSTFRLPPTNDGRAPGVQGPADNGLPPLAPGERAGQPTPAPTTPAPQPTPPAVASTRPATPTPSAPVRRDAAAASASAPRAAQASGAVAAPAAPTTVAAPSATDAGTADTGTPPAAPGFTTDPTVPAPAPPPADVASPAAPLGGESAPPLWAWLLAGAAAAGAGLWYWRRRSATAGDAPAADFEPVLAAPTRQPPPTQRAAAPTRQPPPTQRAVAPAPRPPAPAAPTSAPSPLVTRPADERRAIIGMALDVRGIRLTPDQLIVAFSLNLLNQGSVTATGLMVRIALNQGTAMTEPVLARFFDGAGGSVLRDDMILAPGAGEQLSTEVMLPRATIEPLMVGGKPVLVPVMAFDVTYHWDGEGEAFGQNAGTFVLGREQGGSTSEKLSPLPLDHPNLVVNRPAARTTALKRSQ